MMGHWFYFQLQFFFAFANVRGLIDGFKDFYVFGGYFLLCIVSICRIEAFAQRGANQV
jgi:hypothetical protein